MVVSMSARPSWNTCKGVDGAYAEIVIDMNSTTHERRVLVLQCATFYGLFQEGR